MLSPVCGSVHVRPRPDREQRARRRRRRRWSFGPCPSSCAAIGRAREATQDQEDDEEAARDRDPVAPEADPDLLPVAAGLDRRPSPSSRIRSRPRSTAPPWGSSWDGVVEHREEHNAATGGVVPIGRQSARLACRRLRGRAEPGRATERPTSARRRRATTSRISCVISAWRARFISSVRRSISSPAFLDALRIAVIARALLGRRRLEQRAVDLASRGRRAAAARGSPPARARR